MLETFAYIRPGTLTEAVTLLSGRGARAHAGGTDLLGCLRDDVFHADVVVSLTKLEELRGIRATADGGLRIGALTTVADVAAHAVIKDTYGALAQAASLVASPQLRNQGTIGGNLCQRPRCWYFRGDYACTRKGGDTCYAIEGENQYHAIFGGGACWIVHPSDTAPALVALDATFRVVGPKGSRTVPAGKFFVLPDEHVQKETVLEAGEVLTEILLPPTAGQASAYRKVRARGSWDFAMAGIATSIGLKGGRVADARIVLSGVAPIPWRLQEVEKILVGQKIDARLIAKAADLAVAGARPLEQNAYRVPLVRGIVEEALGKLV